MKNNAKKTKKNKNKKRTKRMKFSYKTSNVSKSHINCNWELH